MLSFKEYLFEIQLLLNIFMITAIVILAFLYLKLSSNKKKMPFIEKIEYLCKNLKVLIDESEQTSDTIQGKVDEFKSIYDKSISEIEQKLSDINAVMQKLESNEKLKGELKDKDQHSRIKILLQEGHDVDSISNMLRISKGEVELIARLHT
ncbi:hypothetical protein ACFL2A_00465 [Thermodesulfobacteriota bacterium]